jgi:hypothetical protein
LRQAHLPSRRRAEFLALAGGRFRRGGGSDFRYRGSCGNILNLSEGRERPLDGRFLLFQLVDDTGNGTRMGAPSAASFARI